MAEPGFKLASLTPEPSLSSTIQDSSNLSQVQSSSQLSISTRNFQCSFWLSVALYLWVILHRLSCTWIIPAPHTCQLTSSIYFKYASEYFLLLKSLVENKMKETGFFFSSSCSTVREIRFKRAQGKESKTNSWLLLLLGKQEKLFSMLN